MAKYVTAVMHKTGLKPLSIFSRGREVGDGREDRVFASLLGFTPLTASGSLYTVSYEGKRRMTGIDFRFASVRHVEGRYQGTSVWYTPTDMGDYDEVTLAGFWNTSQPQIYDYVTSFDCIYDDGSRETIDLTQAVNYNNSNITCTSGGTLSAGSLYRNSNGFYSYTYAPYSYQCSDYINQGKTYLDRTFTISYTVNGNTYSATRTLRHQGNLWIVYCSEPSFTSAGQTVELRVYGYCSVGPYEECDLTNYITSVSTTATDKFEVNGTRTFYVKPGISNTASGPISAVLTASSGNTSTANSTIWGAEATKWIRLLVDNSYWDDYENYWDCEWAKTYFNIATKMYEDSWGDVFDYLGVNGGNKKTSLVLFVYRCKGDGSLENISNSSELSWSYNQFLFGVYSAYNGDTDYSTFVIDAYQWGQGWPWPPRANTSYTNQYVLFSGIRILNEYHNEVWENGPLYYTPAYEEYDEWASYSAEPIDTFYWENFIEVTYRGLSSHISLTFDPEDW